MELTPTLGQLAQGAVAASARRAFLLDDSARARLAGDLWSDSTYQQLAFGQLFAGLESLPSPPLHDRGVSLRASNLLRTNRLNSWPSLAAASAASLQRLSNLGGKTFLEIIEAILIAWAEADIVAVRGLSRPPTEPAPAVEPERAAIAARDAQALADVLSWLWRERGTRTFAGALSDAATIAPADLPSDVATSIGQLAASNLDQALSLPRMTTADWEWLLEFDERALEILDRRLFTDAKATLEELAVKASVSRERIRQIERDALKRLEERQTADRVQGLRHIAARLRRSASGLIAEHRFNTLVEELLDESGAPAAKRGICSGILRRTAGEWTTWAGHVISIELMGTIDASREAWREAGAARPIPHDEIDALLERLGVSEPSEALFEELGVRILNGVAVWWGRTHGDRAVAILTAHDRVLRLQEIHTAVGSSTSPRSMQNALLAEERVMRRGKDTWGLRSWGGEEYSGLFDELEQAIERAGGRVPLKDLIERFVLDFGVKASSVQAYAADRRFIKNSDGTLSMRTAADPEVQFAHIPIELTAGAYRLEGTWHVCLEVDDDALRGSGRMLRRGIGQEAGLEPDLTFAVIYDAGTVIFNWPGTQPGLGSIRELLAYHACTRGDLLLLPLSGSEPRPTRVSRLVDRRGWTGVARVAAEMGLDPSEIDEDEQPVEVADALGLPPGADWHDIADRIRDRRDRRVAAFLPEYLR